MQLSKMITVFLSTTLLFSSIAISKAISSSAVSTTHNKSGAAGKDADGPGICCPGALWPSPKGPCVGSAIAFCACVAKFDNKPGLCQITGCSQKDKGGFCGCVNNGYWPCPGH